MPRRQEDRDAGGIGVGGVLMARGRMVPGKLTRNGLTTSEQNRINASKRKVFAVQEFTYEERSRGGEEARARERAAGIPLNHGWVHGKKMGGSR